MENAGRSVADEIYKRYFYKRKNFNNVIFFCGVKNNGGQGLVAARHLAIKGINISVYIVGGVSNFTIDTELNFRILRKMGLKIYPLLSDKELSKIKISNNALLVDAIFGLDIDYDIVGFEKKVIDKINKSKQEVVSIDIPSGLNYIENFGIYVKTNLTITFTALKKIFLEEKFKNLLGEIVVVSVGIDFLY
jgi:NAD(P)H-hydrate epimerase